MREIVNFAAARATDYSHTANGLLTKRADLYNEAERIRDRLAEIKNDISAVDRVLGTLGYTGELDAAMPRQKREVIFGRGELSKAIYVELRHAVAPLSSREIAQDIVAMRGEDARDRKYISDLTRRVSKALRVMKQEGRVRSMADAKGNLSWERRATHV
jgi:outer membrane translocation and assembly module TamA